MVRATSRNVCSHFAQSMRDFGVPQEILTDNGKVSTGRFGYKQTEVLFDRICRESGIESFAHCSAISNNDGQD